MNYTISPNGKEIVKGKERKEGKDRGTQEHWCELVSTLENIGFSLSLIILPPAPSPLGLHP